MAPSSAPWFPLQVAESSCAGGAKRARPKSSTFTRPRSLTMTLPGFTSRWTTPCSCASASASATWRAMGRIAAALHPPALEQLRERAALHVLHRDVGGLLPLVLGLPHVVDDGHVRVVEGGRDAGLAHEAGGRLRVARGARAAASSGPRAGEGACPRRARPRPSRRSRAAPSGGSARSSPGAWDDPIMGPSCASAVASAQAQGRVEFAKATRPLSRW